MAKGKQKVIITCAVTGAIHTPSMSPHLPVTAEEIAEAAIGAARAAPRCCTCMHAIPGRASLRRIPRCSSLS